MFFSMVIIIVVVIEYFSIVIELKMSVKYVIMVFVSLIDVWLLFLVLNVCVFVFNMIFFFKNGCENIVFFYIYKRSVIIYVIVL